ncbi:KAP family NTPase [Streptococcus oralis]|uniref:P-loop NTPase fold protein n=2 Tax=Streptococcus oralis TaxID=1303 RepID=UPI002109297F|nr:P-loop NTPase fold protein [Streptococcus oralis]MCQ5168803.1 KAP family NTPase [Streptococcus oralis]
MTENNFIKLDQIDTATASKNFANLLRENKTYFLNGTWGSGKSTFLKEVDDTKQVKLVIIDFWRLNDSRSTLETVFARLHPFVYWGLRLIVILCIALSILMTNVVDLGLSAYVPNWVVLFAGVIALIVAIHQFLKIKSDGIYSWLLTKNYLSCRKKILVVDDFDRMTPAQQEASYKLFSLLNGKLPIIFIGDIEIIHRSESNYLSKIIDRRIELPFVLHPTKIWSDYFEQLEKRLEIKLSDGFKRAFITDERNLRDRERFNDYVNLELIGRNKEEYVQIEQQLIVIYIYIYIFYPKLYEILIKEEKFPRKIPDENLKISVLFTILRKELKTYPLPCAINKESYLISEMPSNRTPKELNSLIGNEQLLYEELDKIINSDFTDYISVKFTDIDFIYQKKLFDMAFKLSEEEKNNWLIDLIIGSFAEIEIKYPIHIDILTQSQIIDFLVQVHDFWKKNTVLTDFSDMLYYSFKHKVIDKEHIRGLVTDISPFNKMFSSYSRKEQIILFYIYINRMDEFFSRWDKELLDLINNLDNQEFIDFLLGFGYIINTKDNECDFTIDGKSYVIDYKFIKLAGDEYFDKISNVFDNRLDKIKDK